MLVSGGAFALFSQPAQNQNGFVITAAAAELTKDKPVQVAAIDRTDRYFYGYEAMRKLLICCFLARGDNIGSTITYNYKAIHILLLIQMTVKKYIAVKYYRILKTKMPMKL